MHAHMYTCTHVHTALVLSGLLSSMIFLTVIWNIRNVSHTLLIKIPAIFCDFACGHCLSHSLRLAGQHGIFNCYVEP